MQFDSGEEIILDDGYYGYRKKLTLTNKRLIIRKGKGVFSVTWELESEILLKDIEEAYIDADMDVFSCSNHAMLKMKNGESLELRLELSSDATLGALGAADIDTDMILRRKGLFNKWVFAINNQLQKLQFE